MTSIYELIANFKKKYNHTGKLWILKKHCKGIEHHLNPLVNVQYAFGGQKNDLFYDVFSTCVIAITNKRILIGQKRVVFGYFLTSITPDLFNDMEVYQGLFWGKITIDTVKEVVVISNLDKRSLPEIETNITEFMMEEKKKYAKIQNN